MTSVHTGAPQWSRQTRQPTCWHILLRALYWCWNATAFLQTFAVAGLNQSLDTTQLRDLHRQLQLSITVTYSEHVTFPQCVETNRVQWRNSAAPSAEHGNTIWHFIWEEATTAVYHFHLNAFHRFSGIVIPVKTELIFMLCNSLYLIAMNQITTSSHWQRRLIASVWWT